MHTETQLVTQNWVDIVHKQLLPFIPTQILGFNVTLQQILTVG